MIEARIRWVSLRHLGNHEFDFDLRLCQRMKESNFVWVAANVIDKKTGKPFGGAESFVIREFGGVKSESSDWCRQRP